MITSKIKIVNQNPMLEINGELIASNAYITYFIEKARYHDFAKEGYQLFSVPLFFASQSITEVNKIPPFGKGIFDNDEPDFSIVDRAIEQILNACPNAYIFPRVNMSLPLRWEKENPDELCDTGNVSPDKRRPCFSSDKWAEDTKKYLGMFIEHIEHSSYKESICGYQLSGGNTEEWFSFDLTGSIGKRSREKFKEYIEKNNLEGTEAEYFAFLSQITAERICEFAEYVKEKTAYKLIVGSFYGYTFETPERTSCHHALNTVLNCEHIDFLCSPVSYMLERSLGVDHPCMLPLDSLKKHGKLYFVENDARSHLTKPLFDVPHFYNHNWQSKDRVYTIETLKMFYSRALIHGHALWWFDMGGGWYDYTAYMEMFSDFLSITKNALDKDMSSVSEVAVLIDETACFTIRDAKREKVTKTCYDIRRQLGLMGTPYDSYLVNDYESIMNKYKAFIVLVPEMTPTVSEIIAENENCLVIYPENSDITTEELRSFLREKKVHIYSNKDAVVYVNQSYLFLHTAEVGRADLSFPDKVKLKQIYGDNIDIETDILPRYTGYLFEKEN